MKKTLWIICGILVLAFAVLSFKTFQIARADTEPEPVSNPLPWGLYGENGIEIENAWKITNEAPDVTVGVVDSGICEHKI